MTVRIQAKPVNIAFIQAYAPTNDADAQQTQAFYQLLSMTQKSAKSGDMVITMGDFNAKISTLKTHKMVPKNMTTKGDMSVCTVNGSEVITVMLLLNLQLLTISEL